MWSGPRNISTAMMRAFENRPDCAVVDEPFYAAFLSATGQNHPLREAVLASQPINAPQVITSLLGPAPGARAIFYQKHMTHHMLPDIDRAWIAACRNAFLIRAPKQVLLSYRARRDTVTLEDIGYVQQAELFDAVCDRLGKVPPVIDAADVLADPRAMLTSLCRALDIPFRNEMLSWPAGPRPTDGVWAPAWYGAVERSTGFQASPEPDSAVELNAELRSIEDAAQAIYQRLQRYKLQACS
jgi:hypothetical protein